MISQTLEKKLQYVYLLFIHGLLFILIPVFFLAMTDSSHEGALLKDPYLQYGLQALFGILSGVSASLFFMIFTKISNNDVNCLKPEIESIHRYMNQLNKTFTNKMGCAALNDNPYSNDIMCTDRLIRTEKEVETILISQLSRRLEQERDKYINSNHILTLTDDLLRGFYAKGGDGLGRLLNEKKLPKEHVIRRIVIVEDDVKTSPELHDFISKFEGSSGWRVISRVQLTTNEQKRMFRDFAIYCNQYKEPEIAMFTYITACMENLFTKSSWAPYCTSNKEYIKDLHDRFEELWNEKYVKCNTIEAWLKDTSHRTVTSKNHALLI